MIGFKLFAIIIDRKIGSRDSNYGPPKLFFTIWGLGQLVHFSRPKTWRRPIDSQWSDFMGGGDIDYIFFLVVV